ncbi:response regulator transcription factor [Streptomyces sp. S1A1-7]|uniref:response regulator transcription factor n=1 Tax=Streptomyces sp. S1A1-7 TaxID=2594459 RepID=UPI001F07939C|nr:response regulator transcription factor [Streptomyces sp. S1A1-7]
MSSFLSRRRVLATGAAAAALGATAGPAAAASSTGSRRARGTEETRKLDELYRTALADGGKPVVYAGGDTPTQQDGTKAALRTRAGSPTGTGSARSGGTSGSPCCSCADAGSMGLVAEIVGELVGQVVDPEQDLSHREIEVVRLLAEGRSNRAIAEALYLSEATVKTHLVRAYRKLRVGNRAAAVCRGLLGLT